MSTLTINLTNVQPLDTILTGLSALGYSGNAGLYIKVNATADGFEFAAASGGGGTWGSITGTLSSQTDLQNALNAKASLSGATFTGNVSLGANQLTVHNIIPDASDGLLLESNNGTDIALLGAGNTANATWYGNHNFEGGTIQLGKLDTTLGKLVLFGSTSGQVTIQPNAIAGTNIVLTAPATTGTIALTSDLSSYLPLSGGTLTGALTISNVAEGLIVSTTATKAAIKLNSNNYTQILGNGSELNIATLGTTKITFTTNSLQRASISTSGLFIIGAVETSAGVALKRSSTELQVRLADDSAFAPLQASQLTISAGNIMTDTTTGMKIGTGTTQKLGFWNATPIVQPTTAVSSATLVPNLGTDPIQSGDTFDGYTLQQVVKALRNTGFLA